ncbi:hypothetical protein BD626DRAFT_575839 [Schizophyllum amplum]|uniref:F-box domain-containing protein n=1 Tax=Schizophyllum amplum TaxID=97359 RepID=A0A550BUT4_9AGAR|nr:hypothetical protein BD626DRAFT_575839 [Auriculariopsis ampla]
MAFRDVIRSRAHAVRSRDLTPTSTTYFQPLLPVELVNKISGQLGPEDVASVRQTCKYAADTLAPYTMVELHLDEVLYDKLYENIMPSPDVPSLSSALDVGRPMDDGVCHGPPTSWATCNNGWGSPTYHHGSAHTNKEPQLLCADPVFVNADRFQRQLSDHCKSISLRCPFGAKAELLYQVAIFAQPVILRLVIIGNGLFDGVDWRRIFWVLSTNGSVSLLRKLEMLELESVPAAWYNPNVSDVWMQEAMNDERDLFLPNVHTLVLDFGERPDELIRRIHFTNVEDVKVFISTPLAWTAARRILLANGHCLRVLRLARSALAVIPIGQEAVDVFGTLEEPLPIQVLDVAADALSFCTRAAEKTRPGEVDLIVRDFFACARSPADYSVLAAVIEHGKWKSVSVVIDGRWTAAENRASAHRIIEDFHRRLRPAVAAVVPGAI